MHTYYSVLFCMCVSVGVKKRKVTHLPLASSLLYSFFNTLHAFSLLHLFSHSVLLFYSIFEFILRYKLKWWCNELFSSLNVYIHHDVLTLIWAAEKSRKYWMSLWVFIVWCEVQDSPYFIGTTEEIFYSRRK